MHTSKHAHIAAALGLALLAGAPMPAGAVEPQKGPSTPPVGPLAGPRVDPDESPAVLKERIARRLEFVQSAQKRLQEALDKLNAGADPIEVRRLLDVQMGRGALEGVRPAPSAKGGAKETGTGPDAAGEPLRSRRPVPSNVPAGGPDDVMAADPFTGGPGERSPGPMTAEERERIKAVIADARPGLLAAFDEMHRQSPAAAERAFHAISGRLRGIDELRTADPAQFALRLDEAENALAVMRQMKTLFEARARGDAGRLAAERATMRDLLSKQFDLRTRSQAAQIEHLEKRLGRMRAELGETGAKKDRLIDKRLGEMLDQERDKPRGERAKPR